MDKYSDYLKNEAAYQDSKITDATRQGMGKFYHDISSRHRAQGRREAIGNLCGKTVLDLAAVRANLL